MGRNKGGSGGRHGGGRHGEARRKSGGGVSGRQLGQPSTLKKSLAPPTFVNLHKFGSDKSRPTFATVAAPANAQAVEDAAQSNALQVDSPATTSGVDFTSNANTDLALNGQRDNSAKAFMRDVKNVIENSDIVIEVLDARDPLGSRSKQTELAVMQAGKKVVLLMNKIDLIPSANLQAWLRYLRHDYPTLAFKASTQQQRGHLSQGKGKIQTSTNAANAQSRYGSEAVGANALLQLLKNYARTAVKGSKIKQQLTVGVIGPPNVGKSSLINSLLRSRACAVASTPGWTKVVQTVVLEKGIRLLDCPGVVLASASQEFGQEDPAWRALRNMIKVELIEDPIAPIHAMLSRVDAQQLNKLYNIESGFNEGDAHDFLLRVALMRGKIGKGGIVDVEGAARIVLHDWNIGRIAFHSVPPAVHPSMRANAKDATDGEHDASTADKSSSILTGFSEAFDLQALLGEADAELFGALNQPQDGTEKRPMIEARKRVFAPQISEAMLVNEDEKDSRESFRQSTFSKDEVAYLGKRPRDVDEFDSSGGEDESTEKYKGSMYLHSSTAFSEDEMSTLEPQRGRLADTTNGTASKREPVQSRQHRELQRAFGEHEIEQMAPRRSDIRKAQKKRQKRLRKSGADLLDALDAGLALQDDEGDDDDDVVVGRELEKGAGARDAHEQRAINKCFDVSKSYNLRAKKLCEEDEKEEEL